MARCFQLRPCCLRQWLAAGCCALLLAAAPAARAQKSRRRPASPAPAPTAPARPTQAQVALQFLGAVLRADYAAAYPRLAPEVRRVVSLARFGTAAQPLWKAGQRHGTALELYKLGVRLDAGGSSRLFYSFSFAADSVRPPLVVLEATFRDTTSRAVLGFAARPGRPPVPRRQPAPARRRVVGKQAPRPNRPR